MSRQFSMTRMWHMRIHLRSLMEKIIFQKQKNQYIIGLYIRSPGIIHAFQHEQQGEEIRWKIINQHRGCLPYPHTLP